MTRGWIRLTIGDFHLENQWEIEPGSVLVLFGPSGSGKTITLRAIAGLAQPQEGHIEVGGQTVYDSDTGVCLPPHRRRVGYLTQQYHLFPHLTVAGNISYALPQSNRSTPSASADRVQELVQAFRLDGLEDRHVWELSGGQQQRAALARALATDPKVLLLDEPFAALDAELRRNLRGELRTLLLKSKIPVLLVTHDREEALAVGDAVQVLDHGKVLSRGEPLAVLGQPGRGRVARLVGVENLLRLRVSSRHPQDGTMVCTGNGVRIEVPLADPILVPGQESAGEETVTLGIRASDIILASEALHGSSARNQLKGVVTSVQMRSPGYEITLDCGVPLRCHITGAALSEMGIKPGQTLWAVFKASSCFLVQEAQT